MAQQAAFFGTIGLGLTALRLCCPPDPLDPCVSAHADLCANPVLAQSVSAFATVLTATQLQGLIGSVVRIVTLAKDGTNAAAQWHLAREIECVRTFVVRLFRSPPPGTCAMALLHVEQEAWGQLQAQLDQLMWNHLLDRQ
jgi:hypothetical protein